MTDKEKAVFDALCNTVSDLTPTQTGVLAVHATLIANGIIPRSIASANNGGIYMLPTIDWPRSQGNDGLFVFQYFGETEVKCIAVGEGRLMIHATNGNDLFSSEIGIPLSSVETTLGIIRNGIVNPLLGREQPQPPQSRLIVSSIPPSQPRRGPSPPGGPRAPPFGQPMGPGELVGPNHPIFTGEGPQGGQERPGGVRDPRFDPIGPGYIGEPDDDHFPPPPFGRPPGRAPLRGPRSNVGPGGMFM